MQKMHAESLIAQKLNMQYGSPSNSRYNHGSYQQKHPYKSPPFHPGTINSNLHTKNTVMAKIACLFKFFIQIKLIQHKIIFDSLLERTNEAPTSQFKRYLCL